MNSTVSPGHSSHDPVAVPFDSLFTCLRQLKSSLMAGHKANRMSWQATRLLVLPPILDDGIVV